MLREAVGDCEPGGEGKGGGGGGVSEDREIKER